MRQVRIEILHPNGKLEQLSVEAERILIGSGAHCDVRLPIDQAAPEHVSLQVTPGGIVAEAIALNPTPLVNDVPFTKQLLTPESILAIAQTQLRASTILFGAGAQRSAPSKMNPLVLLVALVLIGVGVYTFTDSTDDSPAKRMPADFPDLFSPPIATCPQRDREAARELGRTTHARADSKRERRPFKMKDGVDAVPLYELTSVCYAAAGDAPLANEARGIAEALKKELNDDYRVHRVRLERALKGQRDPKLALKELQVLISITEGRDAKSKYIAWLSETDRKLRLTLGKSAAK